MESLKNILRLNIKKMGLERRLLEKMIFTDWNKIAGEKIFRNTKPSFMRGGILFVEVPDSVWAHSLMFVKHELLCKINSYLKSPMVKDIRFRCGDVKSEYEEIKRDTIIDLDECELNKIKNMFEGSDIDDGLKGTMKRIVYWQKLHNTKNKGDTH